MANEAIKVRPVEAIEWLRRRLRFTETAWRAFLAGIEQAADTAVDAQFEAVYRDLLGAIAEAVEEGTTAEQFQGDYERIVQQHGWAYKTEGQEAWHSRLIYRLQTQNAYMAGRWEQIQQVLEANKGRTKYWLRYVTAGDDRVRDTHALWHGIVLRPDHPFWLTHWPPNGFNCRCPPPQLITERVRARKGWDVTPDGDAKLLVPPDDGFSGNVGAGLLRRM